MDQESNPKTTELRNQIIHLIQEYDGFVSDMETVAILEAIKHALLREYFKQGD